MLKNNLRVTLHLIFLFFLFNIIQPDLDFFNKIRKRQSYLTASFILTNLFYSAVPSMSEFLFVPFPEFFVSRLLYVFTQPHAVLLPQVLLWFPQAQPLLPLSYGVPPVCPSFLYFQINIPYLDSTPFQHNPRLPPVVH